ncbi:MAG: hypothetical protein ACJ79S_02455, partial [Gemmatimonadaceae bacterium]
MPDTTLDELAATHPEMRRATQVVAALGRAAAEDERELAARSAPAALDDALVDARLAAGLPALTGEALLDGAALFAAVRRVARA